MKKAYLDQKGKIDSIATGFSEEYLPASAKNSWIAASKSEIEDVYKDYQEKFERNAFQIRTVFFLLGMYYCILLAIASGVNSGQDSGWILFYWVMVSICPLLVIGLLIFLYQRSEKTKNDFINFLDKKDDPLESYLKTKSFSNFNSSQLKRNKKTS